MRAKCFFSLLGNFWCSCNIRNTKFDQISAPPTVSGGIVTWAWHSSRCSFIQSKRKEVLNLKYLLYLNCQQNHFFCLKILKIKFLLKKIKCDYLSFTTEGDESLIRALQSSPFQNPGWALLSVTEQQQQNGNPCA